MCRGLGLIRSINLCSVRDEKLTFTATLLEMVPARRNLINASSACTITYVWGRRNLRDDGKMYSVGSSEKGKRSFIQLVCCSDQACSCHRTEPRVGAHYACGPRLGVRVGGLCCRSFLAPELGLCSGLWQLPPDAEHDVLGFLPVC